MILRTFRAFKIKLVDTIIKIPTKLLVDSLVPIIKKSMRQINTMFKDYRGANTEALALFRAKT